jgi:thiol-disulfide isomerase/thioredoxin
MRTRWIVAALSALALAALTMSVPLPWPWASRTASRPVAAACPADAKPANLDFTMKDINGKDVKLSDYKGKVILLDFWATWCGPCKKETPDLVALSKEMSKDVVVVGVSVDQADNTPTIVQNFAEKFSIPYVTIIDNSKIAESYGAIQSIPTTFIIDASGRVVQKIVGLQSKAQFEAAVKRALGQ